MRDLARLAGVSVPTVKRYVRHGLLAPVPFYGTATRYPGDYLVRILALRYWRAAGIKTLAELRRRLDEVTYQEMIDWVTSHPLGPETMVALGRDVAPPTAEGTPRSAPLVTRVDAADALDASLQIPAESWQRWTLMPGLELHLKSEAAPLTRKLAAQLCCSFAALVGG